MGKILVTAASGHLGRKTLQHLLKRRPASDLVGLARDPEKAADLAAQGIEIRKGDYFDYGSLLIPYRTAKGRMGGLCQTTFWRTRGCARLPVPLHAQDRYCQ